MDLETREEKIRGRFSTVAQEITKELNTLFTEGKLSSKEIRVLKLLNGLEPLSFEEICSVLKIGLGEAQTLEESAVEKLALMGIKKAPYTGLNKRCQKSLGGLLKLIGRKDFKLDQRHYLVKEMVKKFLQELGFPKLSRPPGEVFGAIAEFYGLDPQVIYGPRHHRPISIVRHKVCFFLYYDERATFKSIGELLGGRHHTSVLNSCLVVIKDKMDGDEFRDEVVKLGIALTKKFIPAVY